MRGILAIIIVGALCGVPKYKKLLWILVIIWFVSDIFAEITVWV